MTATRQYFGTDGIRGPVGELPITPEFMLKMGWAIGSVLGSQNKDKVLIGKPYLENVLIVGKILNHLKSKKKIIFKMRSKKKTRKTQGHRQKLTRVLIKKIDNI